MKKELGGYEFEANEVREMNQYIRKIATTEDAECIRLILREEMIVRDYGVSNHKKMISDLTKLRKEYDTFIIEAVFEEYYKGNSEVTF